MPFRKGRVSLEECFWWTDIFVFNSGSPLVVYLMNSYYIHINLFSPVMRVTSTPTNYVIATSLKIIFAVPIMHRKWELKNAIMATCMIDLYSEARQSQRLVYLNVCHWPGDITCITWAVRQNLVVLPRAQEFLMLNQPTHPLYVFRSELCHYCYI